MIVMFYLIKKIIHINLFKLDCLTESKDVIINKNIEIAFILNNNIQFLIFEIIEFYLNTRKSVFENDYLEEKTKDKITQTKSTSNLSWTPGALCTKLEAQDSSGLGIGCS